MAKLRLTKTAIEALTPEAGKQIIVWDADLVGFGVRINPAGTKTFIYQGRLNGVVHKQSIGRFGPITAEVARKEAKRIQSMLELGQDPSRQKQPKGGSTLGHLLTAYVDLLKAKGKVSAKAVENVFERDVEEKHPSLWKKPVSQIDLDDCMKIIGKLKDEEKPRQADKLRSFIRTAFSEAINARGDVNMPESMRLLDVKYNPARDLRKVSGSSNAKDRALSLAEFRAYWKHAQSLPEPKRSLVMLHVLTGGQRQQQLGRVTQADIDRDLMAMTIWDAKGRRTKPRRHVIPLLPSALKLIDGISGTGEFVFSCNGGLSAIHTVYLNDAVKSVCEKMKQTKELEGEPFTAGTIRATVETRLVAKPYSVSSDVLGHLLSHGMGGIQQRHYQHHSFFDEKLDALQKLQKIVEGNNELTAQVLQFEKRVSA